MSETAFKSKAQRIEIERMEDGTYYATAHDAAGMTIAGSGRVLTPHDALALLGYDITGEAAELPVSGDERG